MRIRQKYYPYPIMDRGNNSYKDFSFSVHTSATKEAYNVVFTFESTIGDQVLSGLINDGKAVFAYHIQCAQTCYRAVFETNDSTFVRKIKEDDLNGIVEVCPFIIAKEDLKNFSSDGFSSDYTGFRFDIDKGGILAIGDQSQHNINKDLNDIQNKSSIFRVTSNPVPTAENMSVDIRDNKIIVVLPQEQFAIYKSVSKNPITQKTIHAMMFVPALMSVLSLLKLRLERRGDFEEYEECRWLLSLEKQVEKLFGKPLEDLLRKYDELELAQMILKNPMNAAFEFYVNK